MLKITEFTADNQKSSLLLKLKGMVLRWKLQSDNTGVMQRCYQISVKQNENLCYDSGKIESAQSVEIFLPELTLLPMTEYQFTLTVWDNYGESATTSALFSTEVDMAEWQGRWIKPTMHIESHAPYLRKKFLLDKKVKRAIWYASGLGCAEYYVNGKKISEDFMDPPMTNYDKEVLYRAYDVTQFLGKENALVALLGDGWYSQSRVWYWEPCGCKYGDVCLNGQLYVEFEDGSTQMIATDDTWTYKYSPITLNNIYAGEVYDSRWETPDFAEYNGLDDGWNGCRYDDIEKGELRPCHVPAQRIYRKLEVKEIYHMTGDGAWVLDFGENISGIVEITIPRAPRGAQYVLRFAETITENYQLDYRSSGAFATQCIQQDMYIARGDKDGGETWRPRFAIHGFRYVELTGFHKFNEFQLGFNPEKDIAVAYAISTELTPVGKVVVENDYLTRMQKVSINTFLSNYQGFPMDCPIRERCGWLGDSQVIGNYAMMSFDMNTAYEKYLSDIRTQTDIYGVCQMIAPGKRTCGEASSLWGAATIVLPYTMYRIYGNTVAAAEMWPYMEKWVEHERAKSKDLIISEGLGDWDPPGGNGHEKRMPTAHSSTMMFFEICQQMKELAGVLGKEESVATYYDELAQQIRKACIKAFYCEKTHSYGYLASNGVALMLGLYPSGEYENLLHATLSLMKADNYEMHTGIYGNKYLIPALSQGGFGDEAMRFLFNKDSWSFATMLDDGATSVWESLDMKLICSDRNVGINSFNHPMQCAFMIFLYNQVAGLKPLEAGFKRFEIKPCAYTDIPKVDITFNSSYGEISVAYEKVADKIKYQLTIPVNTVCEFTPIGKTETLILKSGCYQFEK